MSKAIFMTRVFIQSPMYSRSPHLTNHQSLFPGVPSSANRGVENNTEILGFRGEFHPVTLRSSTDASDTGVRQKFLIFKMRKFVKRNRTEWFGGHFKISIPWQYTAHVVLKLQCSLTKRSIGCTCGTSFLGTTVLSLPIERGSNLFT